MADEAIDIAERAADALRAAGIPVQGTRLDGLSGRDGCVVRMVAPHTAEHYYDGSRLVSCTLQFVSKHLDAIECMDECERAACALRAADLSSANGSYAMEGPVQADGEAEELAFGADMRHVWCARLTARIIRDF